MRSRYTAYVQGDIEVEAVHRERRVGGAPRLTMYLEFDEYARIVEAAEAIGPTCAAAVLLAGEAGLRVGEGMGLRWCDVDLSGGTSTGGTEDPPRRGRAAESAPAEVDSLDGHVGGCSPGARHG